MVANSETNLQSNFQTKTDANNISRHTLMWLLITNIIILVPLYQQITSWSLAMCGICIIWRIGIYVGKVAKPPKALVASLGFFSAITLGMVAPNIGFLTALINLLILGYALKYIEMRNHRDVRTVVMVGYFLVAFTFIKHQDIWDALELAVVTIINTCVLISLYQSQANFQQTASLGSKIIVQSLPLLLLLFLVFPRLPPFWLVPSSQSTSTTGLSSSVGFGDIQKLTKSNELAFRAKFTTTPPQNNQLYWRAIVLEDYDGKQWRPNARINPQPQHIATRPVLNHDKLTPLNYLNYEVIAEPSSQHWLFGLDVATSRDPGVVSLVDYSLYSLSPVEKRLKYVVSSIINYPMSLILPSRVRALNLALPNNANPKTYALAQTYLDNYPDPEKRLAAMMLNFAKQPYFYTLTPPAVGHEQIDDFLLKNKAGFCVHYASALTFMARATGIPARLVTGYQGGIYHKNTQSVNVYQYMAHAWVEVWLKDKGWVRYDPTAMIAPERVEKGFDAVFDPQESYLADNPIGAYLLDDFPFLKALQLNLAGINNFWGDWVLGFDNTKQQGVLAQLLGQITATKMALFMLICLAIIGLYISYSVGLFRLSPNQDKHLYAYQSVCRKLGQLNVPRVQGEGPMDYLNRLNSLPPELIADFSRLTHLYIALKYQTLSSTRRELLSKALMSLSLRIRFNLSLNWLLKKYPQPLEQLKTQ